MHIEHEPDVGIFHRYELDGSGNETHQIAERLALQLWEEFFKDYKCVDIYADDEEDFFMTPVEVEVEPTEYLDETVEALKEIISGRLRFS